MIPYGAWRSLVAHLLWEQGVEGSNPFAPTTKNQALREFPKGFFCMQSKQRIRKQHLPYICAYCYSDKDWAKMIFQHALEAIGSIWGCV
jgi:hypothetical protein